jgi:hypothetical protein
MSIFWNFGLLDRILYTGSSILIDTKASKRIITTTMSSNANRPHVDECVGTLLIPSTDLQELSHTSSPKSFAPGLVNIKKRVTVGSLMVQSSDLNTTPQDNTLPESSVKTLQRRITKRLQGPAPDDSEADSWAD